MGQKVNIKDVLKRLGIQDINPGVSTGTKWYDTAGKVVSSSSPVDGKKIAEVKTATLADYEMVVKKSVEAFK
jgi:aldehyde dehydrogenase (NAD+)